MCKCVNVGVRKNASQTTHLTTSYLALQLCEAKTKAIVAKLTPLLVGEENIEELIAPIMMAERKVHTAYKEETTRARNWAQEYPPLQVAAAAAVMVVMVVVWWWW